MKKLNNNPAIFLTDYASYNNGTQFEFGHWLDLTKFNDAEELNIYVKNHFKSCDKKSPLDNYDSIREEIMITDFENFPLSLYCESGGNFENIYKYLDLDFENIDLISAWNEYTSEINDCNGYIYELTDNFFEEQFTDISSAVRCSINGNVNYHHDYIKFNGYGNLESFDNLENEIDKELLLNYLLEN